MTGTYSQELDRKSDKVEGRYFFPCCSEFQVLLHSHDRGSKNPARHRFIHQTWGYMHLQAGLPLVTPQLLGRQHQPQTLCRQDQMQAKLKQCNVMVIVLGICAKGERKERMCCLRVTSRGSYFPQNCTATVLKTSPSTCKTHSSH